MNASWSLGTLIGLPVAGLLAVVCIVLVPVFLVARRRADYIDRSLFAGLTVGSLVSLLVVAGVTAFAYYPFDSQYHQWLPKSGVVADVNKRLVSDGDKSMSQKFVVRFVGSPQQYGCNDTRCSQVKKGDRLSLACKRTWQYAGTDGWDCNFVDLKEKA